ncbi:hypothetical protein CYMTET_26937 [Cymbomonas tetramitiformis]|uniref:Uncharacterized protein n=1 Tax=Cymbomonas tetramitiformis TaxID=36881 RepID=A0AAE0FRG1_9CHLO|nr:hypothetical protein CYMTET_26937 [Cymbomonas tetramitiformis]
MRQSLQKQEQHITGFQTQLRTQLRTQRAKPSQTAHAADSTQKAADLAAQLKAQRDETDCISLLNREMLEVDFLTLGDTHKGENISTALAGSNLKESAPKCSGLLQTRLAAIGAPTRAGALGGLDVRLGPFTSSSRTRRRAGPGADGKAKLQPDGKHRSINELGSTRSPEFWELLLQKLSRGEVTLEQHSHMPVWEEFRGRKLLEEGVNLGTPASARPRAPTKEQIRRPFEPPQANQDNGHTRARQPWEQASEHRHRDGGGDSKERRLLPLQREERV